MADALWVPVMSSTDKREALPDVLGESGYSEAGIGPNDDSTAFDRRTPLGVVRAGAVTDEENPEAAVTADTSSFPTLKRASLQRSDGAGHAADRGVTSSSVWMRAGTVLGVLILCILGAAVVGIGAGEVQTQVTGETEAEGETNKTVGGVEIRRGIRSKPEE